MSLGPYQPQASPGPTPTPSGGTSLTPPTHSSGYNWDGSPKSYTDPQASGGGPPTDFINTVVAKLQQMIGTRYYLISTDQLKAIAGKLWQSVGVEQAWANYKQLGNNYLASFDAQIQNLILNPSADPSIDPTITIDYVTAKQSAGESLTAAELSALSNASMASNATIPKPFGTNKVSGYDFGTPMPKGGWTGTGQDYGWPTHLGVDYGTSVGDRIVSPFAGTVHVQQGVPGYGNYVTITLDNGWKIGFGHVGSIPIQDGARVNPGDLIAVAGQNVGSAQGSVTIVTWQDPSGKYVNPHNVLDPIFSGTTFSNAGIPGAAGTGMPSVNSILDREYPSIKSDFTRYFGTPPSPEDVYNILQHGTSPQQWEDYIRSMTSHIAGMNMGQAYDLRGLADNISMGALGHRSTDGVVKDLFDQGITSQKGVQFWYDEHSPNEIDKQVYNQIYKANQPYMTNVLNDEGGFDPRVAKEQAQRQQQREQSGEHGGGGYT